MASAIDTGCGHVWNTLLSSVARAPSKGLRIAIASAAPAANAVYLDYARHYLKAREGILPAEPDPVL